MIWWGILSIQDERSPACLGPGGKPSTQVERDPSPHQVPCEQASAPVDEEQMGHDFFIRHECGSKGKDWRVFGHKIHRVRKQVQRLLFVCLFVFTSRVLVSTLRTEISSGNNLLSFSNEVF